jgi:two-component system, NtrC family, sensor kinase
VRFNFTRPIRIKPSLAARLMLGYAAVIAGVLVLAWWSHRHLASAESAAEQLSDRSVQAIRLSAELETIMQQRSHLSEYIVSGDPRFLELVHPHRRQFQAWIDAMGDFAHADAERELLQKMQAAYTGYAAEVDDVVRLQEQGRFDEAKRLFFSLTGQMDELFASSQRLFALAEADMHERRSRTESTIGREREIISWLTGLGALFSLTLGFVLSRYAARPIYQLVLRLGASGVVDSVDVDGDELGALEAHVGALLEHVREQERRLQQAEKLSELGEIASEIAHETLNPLAGVKGMLQALRRTSLPRERLALELADMERQLARIEDTVRRLTRYARPLEPHVRPVSVAGLLENAARAAGVAPGARDRRIAVETAGLNGLEWPMDPDLMQQVLVNLLVNACEASSPGASVELIAAPEDGRLCLAVRDRGAGIPWNLRDRLFHPFFTTKPHGNGLGLALSRNIVQEHGGRIEATNAEGGGTVFRVILPAGLSTCAKQS